MHNYCTLFVGTTNSSRELQSLFVEFEMDECDIDIPTCKAGKALNFGCFDHDWIDYVITESPLSIDEFLLSEEGKRVNTWDIKDIYQIKEACELHEVENINFIFHLGQENFSSMQAGAKAEINGVHIQFLGYFWPDGRIEI